MRALRLTRSGVPPELELAELPKPTPGASELLIRVHAAGVTPTELLWYPSTHTQTGDPRAGAVPGHEFSGVVEGGDENSGWSPGAEIYGMNDWFADGATAEYCLARPEAVAPKPRTLSHLEAATVPIGALTAWQGLYERAKLQPGERVLIHGGSGAVGLFAVQLAVWSGAHVVTTASGESAELLRQLGADEAIDYRTTEFDDGTQSFDVVFDTVGGETLARSWSVLKPGGRLVTIAASSAGMPDERTKAAFFIVLPNWGLLKEIGRMIDEGTLKATLAGTSPLTQAADAYLGNVDRHGRVGKWAIDCTR